MIFKIEICLPKIIDLTEARGLTQRLRVPADLTEDIGQILSINPMDHNCV